MKVTYLGHATTLIEIARMRVLTDPLLRPLVGHLRRIAPPVAARNLEGIDLILVSHAHHDHLDVGSLRLMTGSPPVLCPPAAGGAVRRAGLTAELARAGRNLTVDGLTIEVVHADHDGRRWPGSSERVAVGFVLDDGDHRVYFAGDTGLFDDLGAIDDIDVALIPVAGWGPRLGEGHMGPAEAAEATALVAPRTAVPIHWGTYRRILMRGGEDPEAPAREFAAELERRAPGVRSAILGPGESLDLG